MPVATSNHDYDAVIVGGGMVGLSLAVAAARQGLAIALVEHNLPTEESPVSGHFSPRVSAISHRSQGWLESLGVWSKLPPGRACAYERMTVWDGLGQGRIDFDAMDAQATSLGHIVENRWLTQALWQVARECRSLQIHTGRSVAEWQRNESGIRVELDDGRQLTAPVLAACDGRFSGIRKEAGFRTREWDYGQTALVTSIRHQQSHGATARQVFLETGPLALLPLTDESGTQHWTSIVWSANTERAEQLFAMSDNDFLVELNRASEGCLGTIEATDPRHRFPLSQAHATDYIQDNLALLGDAAHAIHPLAGQGVNLGFLDAEALCKEWLRARERGLSPGDRNVLRRYQRQRQAHNLAAMSAMEGFKRLFGSTHPAPVLLRNAGLNLLNRSRLAKWPLMKAAMGELGTGVEG